LQDVLVLNSIIDQVAERPRQSMGGARFSTYRDDDDEDEGPKFKDICAEYTKKFINIFCIWDCCWLWLRVSELLALLVFDPFTELFITLCIIVNVLFMAADHYDIEYDSSGGM
jgi:hypothetical protein